MEAVSKSKVEIQKVIRMTLLATERFHPSVPLCPWAYRETQKEKRVMLIRVVRIPDNMVDFSTGMAVRMPCGVLLFTTGMAVGMPGGILGFTTGMAVGMPGGILHFTTGMAVGMPGGILHAWN